jgi:hypothetical protein
MDPSLLVPGLAALTGLAGGAALALDRRHARRLSCAADRLGWSYAPRGDAGTLGLPGEPFDRGLRHTARHVLTGTCGGRAGVAFEHRRRLPVVRPDGSASSVEQVHAVGVMRLPAFLPLVELVPAGRLGRVLPRGLELESEAFNARYRVRTHDPRLAYEVLSPRTMQLLLDAPPLRLRLLGGSAVTWRQGPLDPPEVLARLAVVAAVLDAVPARVWRDHGSAA